MRAMKRLALVALFALPMVLTGCEKLGDATGPEMSKVPSAAHVKGPVQNDSTEFESSAAMPPPPPDGGYDPAWP